MGNVRIVVFVEPYTVEFRSIGQEQSELRIIRQKLSSLRSMHEREKHAVWSELVGAQFGWPKMFEQVRSSRSLLSQDQVKVRDATNTIFEDNIWLMSITAQCSSVLQGETSDLCVCSHHYVGNLSSCCWYLTSFSSQVLPANVRLKLPFMKNSWLWHRSSSVGLVRRVTLWI